MAAMAKTRLRKTRTHKVGYSALALYAAILVGGGLGVYGWSFTDIFTSSSDKLRAEVQTGRMLVATDDRVQCRSYTFDNATAQMSSEKLTECADRPGTKTKSFGVFQDSFSKR